MPTNKALQMSKTKGPHNIPMIRTDIETGVGPLNWRAANDRQPWDMHPPVLLQKWEKMHPRWSKMCPITFK